MSSKVDVYFETFVASNDFLVPKNGISELRVEGMESLRNIFAGVFEGHIYRFAGICRP